MIKKTIALIVMLLFIGVIINPSTGNNLSFDDVIPPATKIQHSSYPAHLMYVTSMVQTSLPHIPAIPSSHPGSGPIIWNAILPAFDPAVSIGNNGTHIFACSTYTGNFSCWVCFQLFATQSNGQALWQYTIPNTGYAQVDASKERDILVGLAADNQNQPEQPPFQRLYKWTSVSSTPDWYFDIPLSYHVYKGGFVEHNLALSGDGTRVILAATNWTNNLIQIFQFDADNGTLLTSYPLHLDPQDQAYVCSLDVASDGSLILVTYFGGACLVDLTTQTLRWTSDFPIGAISGDGSTLVSFSGNNNLIIIVLEWNVTNHHYHERWRQPFLPLGWAFVGNAHPVDISEDGSTIIVGVSGDIFSPPALQTKTVLFDSQSGKLWENTTHGHGTNSDMIIDVRLSRTGLRAIVASTGDKLGSVDQLRVFDRNNSYPRFSTHTPLYSYMVSADITRDGAFATAAVDTGPFSRRGEESILYSFNASGRKLVRNLSATFRGGRVFRVHIKNLDNETTTNIPWTMYIAGGILNQVSFRAFGFIPSIDKDETVTVTSERIIGFGRIHAYVTIESTWYRISGWIIGRYIFLKSPRNMI
jgi:hypothetical protein